MKKRGEMKKWVNTEFPHAGLQQPHTLQSAATRDVSMTSQPEEADFFSSVWNPAFVQRCAAPVGCVYRLRRPN